MKRYTEEEIEQYRTSAGGYRRKDLEKLGVNWPPMKGWKRRLMEGKDPNRQERMSIRQLAARAAAAAEWMRKSEEREWEQRAWERFEKF